MEQKDKRLKKSNNEWSMFLSNLRYIWHDHILEKSLEGSLNIVDERATVSLLFKYMMECYDEDAIYYSPFGCCTFNREDLDAAIEHLIKEGVITVNEKEEKE